MTTITRVSDSATTVPLTILGYDTTREDRNVVRDLIGGGIAVTLVPPRPRAGELEALYSSEDDAWAGYELLSASESFTLVDADRPGVDMTFTPGNRSIALDPQTRDVWVVSFTYQELEP